jgi:Ca-activated chloride channel family protein
LNENGGCNRSITAPSGLQRPKSADLSPNPNFCIDSFNDPYRSRTPLGMTAFVLNDLHPPAHLCLPLQGVDVRSRPPIQKEEKMRFIRPLVVLCLSAILTILGCRTPSPASSVVIVSPSADGSTGISGTVLQAGVPLPGASVVISSPQVDGIHIAVTDANGRYGFRALPPGEYALRFELEGMQSTTRNVRIGVGMMARADIEMRLSSMAEAITVTASAPAQLETMGVVSYGPPRTDGSMAPLPKRRKLEANVTVAPPSNAPTTYSPPAFVPMPVENTEEYSRIHENGYRFTSTDPLSTFSIDVDRASYSNVRRFVMQNQLPPRDAVRIEEMLNYFSWDYPQPERGAFEIVTESADCPWNEKHRLVQIGIQGKEVALENLPPSNLVFLVDVSGSMQSPDKLPLVKQAFGLLIEQLRPEDRVAIVVYAGAAGLVLPSTPGSHRAIIRGAIDALEAGGSTAGGAGIGLAYAIARDNFIKGGNNRVILATDGDFNVGVSSVAELEQLITERRKDGVFLSVLGFGTGNLKDANMEKLADTGNGNYAYVDSLMEAKKVMVDEIAGTLLTIAKDVKIQVEFNPTKVGAYRLIGYENRALANEDFNDDTKDAGELGAGHSVTALYEIVPLGAEQDLPGVDPLKYQRPAITAHALGDELLTVKLRYKEPDGERSALVEQSVGDRHASVFAASENLRFAAAIAELGMLLRDSEHRGNASWDEVLKLAESARGKDGSGLRAEFLRIVQSCRLLKEAQPTVSVLRLR